MSFLFVYQTWMCGRENSWCNFNLIVSRCAWALSSSSCCSLCLWYWTSWKTTSFRKNADQAWTWPNHMWRRPTTCQEAACAICWNFLPNNGRSQWSIWNSCQGWLGTAKNKQGPSIIIEEALISRETLLISYYALRGTSIGHYSFSTVCSIPAWSVTQNETPSDHSNKDKFDCERLDYKLFVSEIKIVAFEFAP